MSKELDKIIDETKQYFKKENKLLLEVTQELKSRRNIITELEEKIEQKEKENEILKKKLYDIQQYIEHKKVCGKSINFSDADLTTNEIMEELEEILY